MKIKLESEYAPNRIYKFQCGHTFVNLAQGRQCETHMA